VQRLDRGVWRGAQVRSEAGAAALVGQQHQPKVCGLAVGIQPQLQNDLRTTALQAIGGLALLAGAVLAFQQLTADRQQAVATQGLTRQGQASERFTRAIDQLGSDRREVQLGGIYGLEQVAQQAPDNRLALTEVLVAYLHRRVPRPAKPPPSDTPVEDLRTRVPDAQAALTVLGRRVEQGDPRLDLRALDLRRADLHSADLRRADLLDADLRRAFLLDADLRDANLGDADLRRAFLGRAFLGRAVLRDADLRDANFGDADLGDAVLSGADLRGAVLSGAALGDAVLLGADLRGATADQNTLWPGGFDWQGAGVRPTRSNTSP
jgi:hypothetical protein